MADKDEFKSARVIFIMGGPGSGKATQCERLVSTYGLTHLSTGDLLRTEIALGSDSAYRLKRTMLNNELVPVTDIIRLLGNAMRARLLDSPGFLIDGCPRDREQAMSFEMMLVPCRVAVFLDVPEDVMVQRLLRRGRRSDREEIIQRKMKTFKDKTLSVVKYFEKHGKLVRVDGTGTVSEVFSRVRDGLMSFRPKTPAKEPNPVKRGKMTSRVMAFKTAVARQPPDAGKTGGAHKGGRKIADSSSSGGSGSVKIRSGAKAATESSSPAGKPHKSKGHKQHHRQHHEKTKEESSEKQAAKQQSPKHKKDHKDKKHKHHDQNKKQTPEQHHEAKKLLPEQHHAAKKQLPEQHHQAKKKNPEQHHEAKKQLPEKHHEAKKQHPEPTSAGQEKEKSSKQKARH